MRKSFLLFLISVVAVCTVGFVERAMAFSDVAPGYWAEGSINAIYRAGYTTGYGVGTFAPELNVTREQMAAFIIRAADGEPAANYCSTGSPFPDCSTDSWSCKYIKRLFDLGLTTGYGTSGLYMPSLNVTRAQMAAFITRAVEGEPAVNYCASGSPFTDVTAADWSCVYIKRLYELGITTGYGDGRYGPEDLVTRAQMAVFLTRAFLTRTFEASGVVGVSGGIVEVTNTESPLYEVKISIPAGALPSDTRITISKAWTAPLFPNEATSQGIAAEIGPSGTTFAIPATVTIPYSGSLDESSLGVFTTREGEPGYIYLPFDIIDKTANRAEFKTSHLSASRVDKFPKLPSGTHRFFIEGFDSTAQNTIDAAIRYGTFLLYYDCTGSAFQRVTTEAEADLIVRLGDIPKQPNENGVDQILPAGFIWLREFSKAEIVINNTLPFPLYTGEAPTVPSNALDLYSMIVHELSHYYGMCTQFDSTYPGNGVFDDFLDPEENARVLQPMDETLFELKYPECQENPCVNIAGEWTGTASDGFDSLPISLSLSQVACTVMGTLTSPQSCPGQCGNPTSPTTTLGNVSDTAFNFTISNDPLVNCDTCGIICYGTDIGTLSVIENTMQGNLQIQDCEMGGYDTVSVNLTRSGFASISSVRMSERNGVSRRSSLLFQRSGDTDNFFTRRKEGCSR